MEIIMNNSIFNAYSDVYSTAMMRDVRSLSIAATANKATETRFSKLVKLFSRA
jgi:hypothetical protein